MPGLKFALDTKLNLSFKPIFFMKFLKFSSMLQIYYVALFLCCVSKPSIYNIMYTSFVHLLAVLAKMRTHKNEHF